MKKVFTLLAALAVYGSINAVDIKILNLGSGGVPGVDEPMLMGLGISPDGHYACGSLGFGYFVADATSGEVRYELTDDDEGAELRHISNNGIAIGYNGPGVTYNIEGVETVLKTPEGDYQYVLGEDLTNDGSVMVGSLVTSYYITYPAYSKDGGEWMILPLPGEDVIGDFADDGGMAKYISGDGKVIVGCVGNFGPAVIWTLDDNDEYQCEPLFVDYCATKSTDSDKPFLSFGANGVSDNGRYVLLAGALNSEDHYGSVPMVYDLTTKKLTIYDEKQDIDGVEMGLYPSAITNDGTFIGILGSMMYNSGGFIMPAGETQARLLATAYPEAKSVLGLMDDLFSNVPISISADGRYILGYGLYTTTPEDLDNPVYYVTYILDTYRDPSSIRPVETVAADTVEMEYFTIDGRKQPTASKGINIVKMSDGTVRKVLR